MVVPDGNTFTGFVFKIHANIDPNHRSRIAFVKICSGKFERNKNYRHIRLGKTFKYSSPTAFMADKKEVIEEAYPGDIVGIPDTGNFVIGRRAVPSRTILTPTELDFVHYHSFTVFIVRWASSEPFISPIYTK
jgi:peptide subunit release factor RF-3